MPIKLQKLPAAVRWGLAVLCAAVCYAASLLIGRALHVHLQA